MKIKFRENQPRNMLAEFDDTLKGLIHVLIKENNDYTLCGHATDEYHIQILPDNTKVTCHNCKSFILSCKKIKI